MLRNYYLSLLGVFTALALSFLCFVRAAQPVAASEYPKNAVVIQALPPK